MYCQCAGESPGKARFIETYQRLWYVRVMASPPNNATPQTSLAPPAPLLPTARPLHLYGTRVRNTSIGATEFLRANERMASLLPTALRMASLQKDIAAALPAMFDNCDVLSFQDGALVLATPSSAIAAKLKQQAPKLQADLTRRGWQVTSVKLKVQVTRALPPTFEARVLALPEMAVSAFEELGSSLPDNPQNARLIAAIKSMAARRRAE
jgi:hypothetical protein